ncbi:MAG: ABC-F family ATP-binding cassette domain-containing protein [Alphaproteobacteria bacterium]|jgi:ATP-binding cassette, subfamily F, member 3|nr:ABC-F family ATP-binding cassette domain-containing protein [Alphaproteobacteria bacterium]
MLTLSELSIRIGGRVLIENASVQLPERGRVGLVGRNGTGKSTLLKAILGEIGLESGAIQHRSNARIGTVAQEAPSGEQTPLEHVLAAHTERSALLAELEEASDGTRIAAIHDRLNDIDAHSAPARVARILAGLGFDDAAQSRPLGTFSGGWRMRVALAAGLFSEPDFLLLDEPTNHLDLEASIWLEGFLARYPNGLLLVSHDRDLLNRVADGILHLDHQRLTYYTGNFERFERTRREKLAQQQAMYERQQTERKHIQSFVDRFRYKASKARQAQSRLKMLERMEPIAAVAGERTATFQFPKPAELAPPIFVLERAAVGYSKDTPILRGLDVRIDMDDRIALLGANGNGKTTFLRLLAGELSPMDGELRRTSKLDVGYFAQDQFDQLDPNITAFQHLLTKMRDDGEAKVRGHLGRFGLEQAKGNTKIGDLSGGEKARLVLATITTKKPHMLLLDEPTNHLDIDAREALVQALNQFEGAVVLVSHDPHLVSLVADRLWVIKDGRCAAFDGDVADYRREILDAGRQARREEKKDNGNPPASKKEDRRRRAEMRAAQAALRTAVRDTEKQMEALAGKRDKLAAKLADPKIYEGPTADFAKLAKQKADLDQDLTNAEAAWLQAQEALDAEA